MRFGKHKGCDFFSSCGDTSVPSFTFANEFFLPSVVTTNSVPSCSSGRLSKTTYKLQDISSGGLSPGTEVGYPRRINAIGDETISEGGITIGEETTEYNLGGKGGLKETNYCPIAQYDSIYYGNCFETNTNLNTNRHEKIGSNSFCVLSSLEEGSNTDPDVLPLCYEMKCSSQSLSIKVGDYYIVCPREGGKIKAEHFNGFILCPDYN